MSAKLTTSDPDPIFILRSHSGSITALKFCQWHGEEVLISGNQNGLVLVWDIESKRIKFRFQVCSDHSVLYADTFSSDGRDYLITHDRQGCIQLFTSQQCGDINHTKTIFAHPFGFCPIQLIKADKSTWLGYPCSSDSQVALVEVDFKDDVNMKEKLLKPTCNMGMLMHFRMWSHEEKIFVICGYESGDVTIWNANTCEVIETRKIHTDPVMCMDVDWSNGKMITGSADNVLNVSKLDQDFRFQLDKPHKSKTTGFACVCIRPDQKIVCCGGWDGKLRVFGWKSMKALAVLKYHEESINVICYSDHNLIAAACKDGKISIWDVYTKK